ncbi:MAG: HDIG domain-containing protein [Paludibacter sp.]|nr:HDIG domain-containing protein [Paludibacter sp.]
MNTLEIIEKYYPHGSELYYILTKHSEQVMNKALSIANKHPEMQLDLQFIEEAAMLHDIGIFRCNAPRIHCHGPNQYIQHGYLGADILRKEGLPRHALVCERHTGVGLSLKTIQFNGLPLPLRDMLPLSLEEQLICYADKFYSKTQLLETHSLERIRTSLRHFGESEVKRFDQWHLLFEPNQLV